MAEWLSRIDIFVLPSRTEALSNALMEAMACSCCAIASRVGGNPELIDEGENGLLFDVDDPEQLAGQIEALLADPARRQRLASAASAENVSPLHLLSGGGYDERDLRVGAFRAQRKGRSGGESSG